MRKLRKILVVAACCCILVGVIPYVIWNQEAIFLSPFKRFLPDNFSCDNSLLITIIRNHLADLLWCLALFLIQDALTGCRENFLTYIAYVIPFACEFCQLAHIIPGTFDPLDILIYLFILIIYKRCRRRLFQKCSNC